MALSDPQSVTYNGAAVSLPRTGISLDAGTFTDVTGNYRLDISHRRGKRNSYLVKLTKAAIVSDPLVPAVNVPVEHSAHIVMSFPRQGVTATDVLYAAKALVGWCTDANLTAVIGGQS